MSVDTLQLAQIDRGLLMNFVAHTYNHGLRMPNKAFFQQNHKLLGLGRQFGQIDFGAFGVFSANYFNKKLSLYIQIPNIYLGLGVEFRLQRIRDLAIVCQ